MTMGTIRSVLMTALAATALALAPCGCDEYEQEQLRQAGDDIDAAGHHIGEASGSAVGRARQGTADAFRNLSDKIDSHNDRIDDAADQANPD